MAGKIFINYRRDDDPSAAARVRDGLAAKFGKSNIFMDVDNLLAGQRFDEELAKALSACDVLIAVMGSRWMGLLTARAASSERDYVREEIAGALKNRIVVIPVRVGRDTQLAPLPRAEALPEDIRDLVHYQKHDVTHERFGRDISELIEAITAVRRARDAPKPWGKIAGGAIATALLGIGSYFGVQMVVSDPAKPPTIQAADSGIVTAFDPNSRPNTTTADAHRETDEIKRMADVAAKKKSAQLAVEDKRLPGEKSAAEKQRLATLAAEEEKNRTASKLDGRLQKIRIWELLKKEFPDWYTSQVTTGSAMLAEKKSDAEVDAQFMQDLAKFRRQRAHDALAAGLDSQLLVARAFLLNLEELRSQSVSACYGYISKGYSSPAAVEQLQISNSAMDKLQVAIFEAVLEGSKKPTTHAVAIKGDWDTLIKELGKKGWQEDDLQAFSNPKLLSQKEPEKICTMVVDWFSAHLSISDPEVRGRLLFETLKPVLNG